MKKWFLPDFDNSNKHLLFKKKKVIFYWNMKNSLTQGFEARGTVLAGRLTTWQNLMEEIRPRGKLIGDPLEYSLHMMQTLSQVRKGLYKFYWK